MSYILASRINDQDAADLSTYLTSLFGPSSTLPKSPADLPGYKATLRPISKDALNIVYVEYEMPGPSRMPFSAAPDKNGILWIPNFGAANKSPDSIRKPERRRIFPFLTSVLRAFILPFQDRTALVAYRAGFQ